jgi:hypothetical protein
MGWTNPKTNWRPGDGIMAGDLNRIEENTLALFNMHEVSGMREYAMDAPASVGLPDVIVASKRIIVNGRRVKVTEVSDDYENLSPDPPNQGAISFTLSVYGSSASDLIYGPVRLDAALGQYIIDRDNLSSSRNNFRMHITASVPYRSVSPGMGAPSIREAAGMVSAYVRLLIE